MLVVFTSYFLVPRDLFDLRQNINLLHLCICDIRLDKECFAFVEFLSQIASFDLQTIHLRVTFTSVETVEWQQLAQILTTRPQFAKLRKVQLDLTGYSSHNTDSVGYVCRQMSILGDILHASVVFI